MVLIILYSDLEYLYSIYTFLIKYFLILHIRIWNIMKIQQQIISPQDIVILLKIILFGDEKWNQSMMAEALHISQSEISKSLVRSKYAKLLDNSGKKVRKLALFEFIKYGLSIVFPQQLGPVVRGIPTAHSLPLLNQLIQSNENIVWASGKGTIRGHSVLPLYNGALKAVKNDAKLHELLALIDVVRIGKVREKNIALEVLKNTILDAK